MRRLLFVAFIVLGSAFVGLGQQPVSAIDGHVNSTSPPMVSQPDAAPLASDYVLGPGDIVSVIEVELGDDFTTDRTFRVDNSGNISIPYVGRVQAAGLTIPQLEQELNATLKKFIKEPDVVVGVAEFHSQPVSVLGEVNTAGEYQIEGRKPLLAALSNGRRIYGRRREYDHNHTRPSVGPHTAAECA